jgi:hypothetical protein
MKHVMLARSAMFQGLLVVVVRGLGIQALARGGMNFSVMEACNLRVHMVQVFLQLRARIAPDPLFLTVVAVGASNQRRHASSSWKD